MIVNIPYTGGARFPSGPVDIRMTLAYLKDASPANTWPSICCARLWTYSWRVHGRPSSWHVNIAGETQQRSLYDETTTTVDCILTPFGGAILKELFQVNGLTWQARVVHTRTTGISLNHLCQMCRRQYSEGQLPLKPRRSSNSPNARKSP